MTEQYVLIWGNPLDGIELVGTFESPGDAMDYGEKYSSGGEWWVTLLQTPEWMEEINE